MLPKTSEYSSRMEIVKMESRSWRKSALILLQIVHMMEIRHWGGVHFVIWRTLVSGPQAHHDKDG